MNLDITTDARRDALKIAVIIPVLNERYGLVELLESLRCQISPQDEIIVADAGSTDGTPEIVQEASAKDPRIRLIKAPGAMPGAGRNVAIRNTDARIIAQVDGRNLPCENWLYEITRPIINGEVDYVTGNSLIMPQVRKICGVCFDLNALYGAGIFRGPSLRRPSSTEAEENMANAPAGGDSVAYKREIWERAGGFPEWLRSGEDVAFVKKIKKQSIRFGFAPEAVVYWQIGPGFKTILNRHAYYQKGDLRTPELIRERALKIAVYTLIGLGLTASIFIDWLRPYAISFWLLHSLRQGIKTYRAFICRTDPTRRQKALAMALLFFIEPTVHLVKFWGLLKGIIQIYKTGFTPFTKQVRDYLDS